MFVVMGATGHIGSRLAENLLCAGKDVTVLTRKAKRAEKLAKLGARIAEINVLDHDALHNLLKRANGIYILNPPANPLLNCDNEERQTIAAIALALQQTKLEKVIVQSTYGAQKGDSIGDLGSLYELEEAVTKIYPQAIIVRAAFYMSNWQPAINEVVSKGTLTTVYPPDCSIPMVAPSDIADYISILIENGHAGITYIEGPKRYNMNDVAHAFTKALGHSVRLNVIPDDRIENYYSTLGFSTQSACSFAHMAQKTIEGNWPLISKTLNSKTTLENYIDKLCKIEKITK